MLYTGPAFSAAALGDGIVELKFDLAGESVNKLNQLAIRDFDAATQAIAKDSSVKGVIVTSGKPVFIVGADITEFGAMFAAGDEGIAKNVLSRRLKDLVEAGVMERKPSTEDARQVEYRLTAQGKDLLPVLIALSQWGERWIYGGEAPRRFANTRVGAMRLGQLGSALRRWASTGVRRRRSASEKRGSASTARSKWGTAPFASPRSSIT